MRTVKAISAQLTPRWLAYCALLLLSVNAKADWKSSQVFYFWNNVHPGVALSTNTIQGIDHASGSVTGVQIGDQNGINTNLCTAFIADCGGIFNCQWNRITNNTVIDAYLFSTCRPLTNGITRVVTNLAVGSNLVIFSLLDRTWYNSVLVDNFESFGSKVDFDDGSSGFFYSLVSTRGGAPTGGNSGSPVFTSDGIFVGELSGLDGPNFALLALYPNGAQYGSPSTTSPGAAGLSALFNSDPDR